MARLAALALVALVLTLPACGGDATTPPTEEAAPAVSGQEVPLDVREGPQGSALAFLDIVINGEGPFPFALDTGASHSIVDREVAEQVGLELTGQTAPITGLVGAGEAELTEVEQWSAGDVVELPPGQVVVLDLPETPQGPRGLLGSDVLSHFGVFTLDYTNQVLVLERQG